MNFPLLTSRLVLDQRVSFLAPLPLEKVLLAILLHPEHQLPLLLCLGNLPQRFRLTLPSHAYVLHQMQPLTGVLTCDMKQLSS